MQQQEVFWDGKFNSSLASCSDMLVFYAEGTDFSVCVLETERESACLAAVAIFRNNGEIMYYRPQFCLHILNKHCTFLILSRTGIVFS